MDKFTNEDVGYIIEAYKNNVDIDTLITYFNCEEKDIRKVLKDNQIDRQYNTFNKELYDRLVYLYQQGKTQKEIADTLQIGEGVIRKEMKRRGLKMRTYEECNRRYYRNSNYFDELSTPNQAYILGFIYADGNVFSSHNTFTITLQDQDKYILDWMKEQFEYEGPVRLVPLHEKNPNYRNQYTLVINDEHFVQSLHNLGVVDKKSLVLQFPDFMPDELMPHFVRGYFDGDGTVNLDEKRHRCTASIVSTYEMCEGFKKVLNNFGCACSIHKPTEYLHNTYIVCLHSNKSTYLFSKWIYKDADMKLERKYKKFEYAQSNYPTKWSPDKLNALVG